MAENTNRLEDVELPHLMVTTDAMDKSKWLVPRSLDSSKRLAALWRPALHVVGVLIAGVLEYFAIVEPDVKADSDLQQTLLARALDLAEDELRKRGKGMPWKVIFHSDNTSKEGRNSQLLLFATALVSSQRFAEVSLAMFRVGHTHNRLDQRFSVIGSLLARVKCLQTPEEYVSHLQEHYRSARGVPVLIEQVGDSYLWRNFFAPLDRHFAGVTGTRSTADAAHVFRVVRRDMVRLCAPEATFLEDDGLESDPVLLAKHWICSKGLSQPPTVLLQGAFPLDFRNLLPLRAPRTALTQESLKQFRKTAHELLASPWLLESAAAYILAWLQRNENAEPSGQLPDISFLVQGRDFLPAAVCAGATWKDFAPEGAIPVQPMPKQKKNTKNQARAKEQIPQCSHVSRRAQAVKNLQAVPQEDADDPGQVEMPEARMKRPAAASKGRPMKRPAAKHETR